MKLPCEHVAATIVPALRAEVAVRLSQQHGMKQIEISHLLGITQGAVSHYLRTFRAKDRDSIIGHPDIDEKLDTFTLSLLNGTFDHVEFCAICRRVQELGTADVKHAP
jgi:predicted transcriptional regulator